MKKIFIALPSYQGQTKETKKSIRFGREALAKAGIQSVLGIQEGICYLCQVRNILADAFLKSDCTDLVFIDDDVSFAPEALLKLVSTSHPLVAGIYRKKVDRIEWPVNLIAPVSVDEQGCTLAALLPTGFMKINRRVFDVLRDRVPHYKSELFGDLVAYFMTGIRNGVFWGEDVAFCQAWRMTGGELHALLDVTLGHTDMKGRTYRGNLAEYLAEHASKRAA